MYLLSSHCQRPTIMTPLHVTVLPSCTRITSIAPGLITVSARITTKVLRIRKASFRHIGFSDVVSMWDLGIPWLAWDVVRRVAYSAQVVSTIVAHVAIYVFVLILDFSLSSTYCYLKVWHCCSISTLYIVLVFDVKRKGIAGFIQHWKIIITELYIIMNISLCISAANI